MTLTEQDFYSIHETVKLGGQAYLQHTRGYDASWTNLPAAHTRLRC